MTTWGDQSLCDAMAIIGIVGDRRMCYLIVQLHMPPTTIQKRTSNFHVPVPLISPNYSPHIISWPSDKISNKLAHICHTSEVIISYIAAYFACRLSGQTHTSDSAYGGLGYSDITKSIFIVYHSISVGYMLFLNAYETSKILKMSL